MSASAVSRLLATAVYLLAGIGSIILPTAATGYNGPTRTLRLLGWSTEITDLGMCFTLYPASILVSMALLAYLDTGHRALRAHIVAPIVTCVVFFGYSALTLLFVLIAADENSWDGDRAASTRVDLDDRLNSYAWLPGIFAAAWLVFCMYAVLRRAFTWDTPDQAEPWWKHFVVGAAPVLAISLTALTIQRGI